MLNLNLLYQKKRHYLAFSARTLNNLKVLRQKQLKVVSKLPQPSCIKKEISLRLNRSIVHLSPARMMINRNFS
jgi:hypothetical protein